MLGSLVTGFLLARYFPAARGSGIPQTKVAMQLEGGFISMRTVIGRFICSCGALASGIALGREGPSVQIGGGLASILGQRLGLKQARLSSLIPVGAAAVSRRHSTHLSQEYCSVSKRSWAIYTLRYSDQRCLRRRLRGSRFICCSEASRCFTFRNTSLSIHLNFLFTRCSGSWAASARWHS